MKKHILALCLVAATALPAFAQTPPAPDAVRDPRRQMSERMCRDVDARLAARLAYTEAKLSPTGAQRSAWTDFAAAARAAAAPMKQICAAAPAAPTPGDLAAQLATRERWMSAMLDSTRQMRAAVEKLQPVLTDEQKVALAQNMRGDGDGRGRGVHGHRGHHGG